MPISRQGVGLKVAIISSPLTGGWRLRTVAPQPLPFYIAHELKILLIARPFWRNVISHKVIGASVLTSVVYEPTLLLS
jgi:hypothetical protein